MNGWVAVAAIVAAYDTAAVRAARPTMSAAFHVGLVRHPVLTTAVTGYLIAHLYGAVPRRFDPLRRWGKP